MFFRQDDPHDLLPQPDPSWTWLNDTTTASASLNHRDTLFDGSQDSDRRMQELLSQDHQSLIPELNSLVSDVNADVECRPLGFDDQSFHSLIDQAILSTNVAYSEPQLTTYTALPDADHANNLPPAPHNVPYVDDCAPLATLAQQKQPNFALVQDSRVTYSAINSSDAFNAFVAPSITLPTQGLASANIPLELQGAVFPSTLQGSCSSMAYNQAGSRAFNPALMSEFDAVPRALAHFQFPVAPHRPVAPYPRTNNNHRTWPIRCSYPPSRMARFSPYTTGQRAHTATPAQPPYLAYQLAREVWTDGPSHALDVPSTPPIPIFGSPYNVPPTWGQPLAPEYLPVPGNTSHSGVNLPADESSALTPNETVDTMASSRAIVEYYACQPKESWVFFATSEEVLKNYKKQPSASQRLRCQYLDPMCGIYCYNSACRNTDGTSKNKKCSKKGFVMEDLHEYIRHLWLHRERERKMKLSPNIRTKWNDDVLDAQKTLDDVAGVVYPDYV